MHQPLQVQVCCISAAPSDRDATPPPRLDTPTQCESPTEAISEAATDTPRAQHLISVSLCCCFSSDMDVLTLLLILLSLLLLFWRRYKKRLDLPPGPFPLPLLGNILQGKAVLYESYRKLSEQYGPVFTVWLGSTPVVVLCGYEVLKDALIDHAHLFGARGSLPITERLTKGYGIVGVNGERWKQMRRFAVTTLRNFGMGKRSMEERIQEEALHLVQAIQQAGGERLDPLDLLERSVNNIINLVVFGRRWDYEDKQCLKYLSITNSLIGLIRSPLGLIYSAFPRIMRYLPGPHQKIFQDSDVLTSFFREQIHSHWNTLDFDSPRDFIDCFLIKANEEKDLNESEFCSDNLVYSILDLYVAGTETTTNTMQFALLVMMKYPHIQVKVQMEIDKAVGSDRLPGVADRAHMHYTNAVIHEIQRFLDLVPMALPHMVTEDTVFRGFNIPKGTTVIPILGSALWDPGHWKSPEELNPEHFLNEKGQFCNQAAFIPFSAGKRICPGEGLARMEIFIFFTALLQKFTIRAANSTDTFNLGTLRRAFRKKGLFYQLRAIPRTCTVEN
ncbi:cytochrome P450 2C20 [Xenopus tropicalis]|uniref:Cytochrome P450 2C20 n=2 Tax=Xenopus tropicalis TaxID=8364 RepID=A0A8J0QN99_XENTR|nr:cytochrome P450 2C20 [Xenopus tropicalis]